MLHTLDLPDFARARVLVFGDLMLDRYISGSSNRISPEAPVPIVKVENQKTYPGGAANVALNLAAVGCETTLLGIIGEDLEGMDLRSQLEAKHISCPFEYVQEYPTITKLRVLSQNQQMLRLDFETTFDALDKEKLVTHYKDLLEMVDVVVLSDYGKGTLPNPVVLIELAKAKNIPVLIDPKGKNYKLYEGASLITPNLSEFEAVVGSCEDEEAIVTKARALMRAHQFGAVLVTRGKQGMSLVYSDERAPMHLHSHAREVFDVTGAGDTVIAMIGACLGAGCELDRACALANFSAGLAVAKVGAATISVTELRNELRDHLGLDQGIMTEKALLSTVNDAKEKGERIVMTNGCFDVLHAGHMQYLREAKALGDRLIVAVNTDESVAKLKGPNRPINSLQARMEQLSALRSVDWVVPFSEDTPERLINEVLPDCLVKGGDYTVEAIAGHKAVLGNGGEVKILSFREGYSTTKILEKLT